jgi:hypothetical protein
MTSKENELSDGQKFSAMVHDGVIYRITQDHRGKEYRQRVGVVEQ